MSSKMLRMEGSQGASITQDIIRIPSLNLSMTYSARNVDKTRGPNAGGGYINIPDSFEDG